MNLLKKIGFFAAFLIPILLIWGNLWGGYWNFLSVVVVYGLIPIFDYLIGRDAENPSEVQVPVLMEEKYYRRIMFIWVYVQLGVVFWAAYRFAYFEMFWWEQLAFLLAVANVTGGIGITVAHELGHQKTAIERFYSRVLLMTVCYMHFYIEHNRGHHVWVATPHDPATSRKGENVYAFWFRTVFGSWKSAWRMETERLNRKGIGIWSGQNEMLWYIALPIAFCILLTLTLTLYTGSFTWQVPIFFVLQSILGFSLLELVNYIEHYGIMRQEIAPNRYERVNPIHSWNANQLLSNFFLFQLQRHSDHHANASRRYQTLRHIDESPQMPQGYPAMIMMALVPPLWFRVMDKRLEDWQAQNS